MNAYITKPFDEHLLIRTIYNLTISHQQKDGALPQTDHSDAWDASQLAHIAKGNKGLILRLMQIFLQETPPALAEMEKALQAEDFERLQSLAHRLKGSVHNMGFDKMAANLRSIELLSQSKQPGIADEFASFQSSIRAALDVVRLETEKMQQAAG
jgi:HPt (histidine-containing phosphotransfer) domain-containing protein